MFSLISFLFLSLSGFSQGPGLVPFETIKQELQQLLPRQPESSILGERVEVEIENEVDNTFIVRTHTLSYIRPRPVVFQLTTQEDFWTGSYWQTRRYATSFDPARDFDMSRLFNPRDDQFFNLSKETLQRPLPEKVRKSASCGGYQTCPATIEVQRVVFDAVRGQNPPYRPIRYRFEVEASFAVPTMATLLSFCQTQIETGRKSCQRVTDFSY